MPIKAGLGVHAFSAYGFAVDVGCERSSPMDTAKDEVRHILDSLPEDATLEDIQYRIYVRQAIDAGLRDIAEGRTLSQKQVEQRVARWIGK